MDTWRELKTGIVTSNLRVQMRGTDETLQNGIWFCLTDSCLTCPKSVPYREKKTAWGSFNRAGRLFVVRLLVAVHLIKIMLFMDLLTKFYNLDAFIFLRLAMSN